MTKWTNIAAEGSVVTMDIWNGEILVVVKAALCEKRINKLKKNCTDCNNGCIRRGICEDAGIYLVEYNVRHTRRIAATWWRNRWEQSNDG
jgi:hypothetical protein